MTDLPDHQKPDILDDDIQASAAPLLSHLKELRRRLIIVICALAGAAFACFFLAEPLYNILLKPLVREA
ncbi:MAG: twin-arginine translocase subunit TatC, partial [Henriciella sp.]